jgi:glycosyltransferase involved in cell wall biosynthesis
MKNLQNLKIFGVPWHVSHQHELVALPFVSQYDLLINPYRTWGVESRPFPEKCRWVTHFKPNYYDLAILHVDQQSIYDEEKGDRISKGRLFIETRQAIGDDCPVIVINHMTPFHDKYDDSYTVEFIKKMIGKDTMICNSHEAVKQWGFGTTITHGMDVDQWWDLPKEPRVITVLTPAGMEKAYRRIFLHQVIRRLKEWGINHVWVGVDKKFGSFDDYRDYLGRSLVYFNPTWQSPMPRARTEAMLSGCCVVTTPYHDADTFIKDGVNGFLTSRMEITDPRVIDNPDFTAGVIRELIDNPERARAIGQEGKKTAQRLFRKKEFEIQWENLVKKVLV